MGEDSPMGLLSVSARLRCHGQCSRLASRAIDCLDRSGLVRRLGFRCNRECHR